MDDEDMRFLGNLTCGLGALVAFGGAALVGVLGGAGFTIALVGIAIMLAGQITARLGQKRMDRKMHVLGNRMLR
jgi:hypothetical protein